MAQTNYLLNQISQNSTQIKITVKWSRTLHSTESNPTTSYRYDNFIKVNSFKRFTIYLPCNQIIKHFTGIPFYQMKQTLKAMKNKFYCYFTCGKKKLFMSITKWAFKRINWGEDINLIAL